MISAPTGRRNAFLQKKKMHGWTTNMIVIQIIIRFRVISLIMNIAIIRIITLEPLYCIASFHILCFLNFFSCFHINSICFSCFHINFFFYVSSRIFFALLSFFFCFLSVSSVIFSDSLQTCKKKKEKSVMCGVSDVIAVKSNFVSPSTKKKYGLAGLYFCSRFRKFTRRNTLKISMIVRDRSDNASANYVISCCF